MGNPERQQFDHEPDVATLNMMQVGLMRRFIQREKGEADVSKWVERYAPGFRKLVEGDYSLVGQWRDANEEGQKKILDEIEGELYKA